MSVATRPHFAIAITTILGCISCLPIVAKSATIDFERDIAPLLNKYCVGCHNADDAESGLSLESFSDMQKGGERGPAFIPGNAASSRLIRVLVGQAKPTMPPEDSAAPTPSEIERLRHWVEAGARGPQGEEPTRRSIVTPRIEPTASAPRPIAAMDYSPDGRLLAVARFRQVELLGDNGRGLVHTLGDHPGKVNSVRFSSDGNRLITASGIVGLYGEARIWNADDGVLLRTITDHRDILYAAESSPVGNVLATAGYDGQIILWDIESGEQLTKLDGHNGAIYQLQFSPNGKVLASASADETIKIWNVATGQRLDTLSQPLDEQYVVTFRPDGRYVVGGGMDNRIRVWSLVSIDQPKINPIVHARFAHEGPIVALEFTTDGSRLVSIGEDRSVKLWDAQTFNQLHLYETQHEVAAALAINPNGMQFAVGRMDGSLGFYEIPSTVASDSVHAAIGDHASESVRYHQADIAFHETSESEPNDRLQSTNEISIPASVSGTINVVDGNVETDVDLFRFTAERGQELVIEVDAARSKSPLDSHLQVLDHKGHLVTRVLLQAVRDSYVEFRGGSSSQTGVRLHNWEEMDLNEYLYRKGEVNRVFRLPRGPDSDMMMYESGGGRRCYFDTSSTAYALHEPCYIVQPHSPETDLVPNGLPVFPIYFENDDDPLRKLGADSKLFFTAPADGQYIARVSDVRGSYGSDYSYKLIVRPRVPDFEVTLHNSNPTVNPASGKEFRVTVDRIDGFEGQVRVDLTGVPSGFQVTSPIVIQAGHTEAHGMVYAHPDTKQPLSRVDEIKVTATAELSERFVTKPVNSLGRIKIGAEPKLRVVVTATGETMDEARGRQEPLELVIQPGQTITADLHLQRIDFDQRVTFEARNLPHGVIVDNIGLNGVLIPEGQAQRTIFLTASTWLQPMSRQFFVIAKEGGAQTSLPILLHVLSKDRVTTVPSEAATRAKR